MHKVSDGQRRRVQICLGLLHPFQVSLSLSHSHSLVYSILELSLNAFLVQVLLLDEVTVDLDVVARMDLLEFFKEECEQVFIYFLILFWYKYNIQL